MITLRGIVFGALLAAQASVAPAQAPARATWHEHEFDFTYMGFTTQYSCDGLRHKVQLILVALGARGQPDIRATGCEIHGGVAMAPHVHVRVAFPEAVAADAGADAFDVVQETVTLSPRRPQGLAAGDCELVEQLRDRVFPLLGTEVVAERTGCVPHQLGVGRPLVQAKILRATGAD